ncbi:MAG: pyruvate kinase alpha/beta domain-containing protein [Candidatus Natronoplasma sp.]
MIDTSTLETEEVLKIAKEYAEENAVQNIVLATTRGETGALAADIFEERYNVVAVTHSTGFREEDEQELKEENRKKMEEEGIRIFTGPMPFHSWNDYYRKEKGTVMTTTVIADTLRLFGQGTKVCVEIVSMAVDAGLVPPEPVVAIAGTGYGADTVLLVEGRNSRRFFDMKVKEVVAKPREI